MVGFLLIRLQKIKGSPNWIPSILKKPLICQAGSAEAFAGSPATGGKRVHNQQERGKSQSLILHI